MTRRHPFLTISAGAPSAGPAELSSHGRQGSREMLEQLRDGEPRVRLASHERAVERHSAKTREVVRGTAHWI
jgi:hypothetical protein